MHERPRASTIPTDRPAASFWAWAVAEVDEQAIAEILGDMPVKAGDHLGTGVLIGPHHFAQLFGSSCAESAVEPTKSQNSTVSWRRSASGVDGAVLGVQPATAGLLAWRGAGLAGWREEGALRSSQRPLSTRRPGQSSRSASGWA